jgi:hypothetical protein
MSRDGGADATVCPSCGTRADAGDRFCSACGTALAEGRGETAAAGVAHGPSDPENSPDGETDEDQHDESEEIVWATDPAAPETASTGAEPADGDGSDRPAAVAGGDEAPADGRVAGDERRTGADDGSGQPADGAPEESSVQEDGDRDLTDAADAETATIEPWQKRCPECGSVLVAQAVRCTGCGATQPDVETADDERGSDHDQHAGQRDAPDTGSDGPESPPPRRGAAEGPYRERRRRDRRPEPQHPGRRREPARGGRDRATDAGGGEIQYERDRRTGAVASEQEPPHEAAGGHRERPRRERSRREPARGTAPDRDRRERLADRQAARRADADTPYEPAVPSSRWWTAVLVPALLTFFGAALAVAADPTAVAAGTVPWVGDGGGLLELGVVLTPTLAPFALYFDRRYVAHETGRTPSAAYYLVAVPYLNLVVTGLYLWWRQQWLAAA